MDQKGNERNRPCGEEKSGLEIDFARGSLRCVDILIIETVERRVCRRARESVAEMEGLSKCWNFAEEEEDELGGRNLDWGFGREETTAVDPSGDGEAYRQKLI